MIKFDAHVSVDEQNGQAWTLKLSLYGKYVLTL